MEYKSIGCVADSGKKSGEILSELVSNYNIVDVSKEPKADIDLLIVLGGDGFMLHTLHKYMGKNIHFYGMNTGNLGFLLNNLSIDGLYKRLENAKSTTIHPLKMDAQLVDGSITNLLAINEVSLIRKSNQAAKLKITIDNAVRLLEMTCDGAMVSTSAGSSAYNFSVGGPIIPIGSNILALTPISPFRPRRWSGALLPQTAVTRIDVLEEDKRPVVACADFLEVGAVTSVEIREERGIDITMLFDADHSLEERLIKEQFAL